MTIGFGKRSLIPLINVASGEWGGENLTGSREMRSGSRREGWGPERFISFFRWAIVFCNLCGDGNSTVDKEGSGGPGEEMITVAKSLLGKTRALNGSQRVGLRALVVAIDTLLTEGKGQVCGQRGRQVNRFCLNRSKKQNSGLFLLVKLEPSSPVGEA